MLKLEIKDLSLRELEDFLEKNQQPAYRAKQIFMWLYKRGIGDFKKMSDLPAELRMLLDNSFSCRGLYLIKREQSTDGTKKFLFELQDGNLIESAIIPAQKKI